MVDPVPGLRLGQMKAVVTELAKLHAWSFQNSGWAEKLVWMPEKGYVLWPPLVRTSAEQVEAMAPELFRVRLPLLSPRKAKHTRTEILQGMTQKIMFAGKVDYHFRMMQSYTKETGTSPVLVHGNMKPCCGWVSSSERMIFRRSLGEQYPLHKGRDAGERSWR